MMVVSDTTGYQYSLDYLTTYAGHSRMNTLGFKDTRIMRRDRRRRREQEGKESGNKRFGLGGHDAS